MTTLILNIDNSKSMSSMGEEPKDAIRTFLEDFIKGNPDGMVSVYFFGTKVHTVFKHKPVSTIDVDGVVETFNPSGMTARNDAVGLSIKEHTELTDVKMVILTDGDENSSTEYTTEQTVRMLNEHPTWKVVDLGANNVNPDIQSQYVSNVCYFPNKPGNLTTMSRTVSNCLSGKQSFSDLGLGKRTRCKSDLGLGKRVRWASDMPRFIPLDRNLGIQPTCDNPTSFVFPELIDLPTSNPSYC